MKICPNCTAENADNVSFCISCGQKIESMETISTTYSDSPFTGFSLDSDSVRVVWMLAILVGVILIITAILLSETLTNTENSTSYMPIGLVSGYVLCLLFGFLVLRDAKPSQESPWAASKKVGKILVVIGLVVFLVTGTLGMSDVDNEAMNQAMMQGEYYDFPLISDLGGSFGFGLVLAWLLGGFVIVYGIMRYQLQKIEN